MTTRLISGTAMKHIFSVLLQNKPGVLSRITGSGLKIEAIIDILGPITIQEIGRTGKIASARSRTLTKRST